MRVFTTICAMALPLPLVHAQIQTNLRALTPLTIQISDGINTASTTTPAGPLSSGCRPVVEWGIGVQNALHEPPAGVRNTSVTANADASSVCAPTA